MTTFPNSPPFIKNPLEGEDIFNPFASVVVHPTLGAIDMMHYFRSFGLVRNANKEITNHNVSMKGYKR